MSDFTIVIPHRGFGMGLWATVQSCEEDLRNTNFNYNYVIVTNGDDPTSDVDTTLFHLKNANKLKAHLHYGEPVTPPYARQRGAAEADGDILFFFDNHCLVCRDYFRRMLADFNYFEDMAMLHSTTMYYSGLEPCYHYKLRLKYNFWADAALFPATAHKPYKMAVGGHGGFAVRRSVWEDVGGYGPEGVLVGYAGEEMLFDLKVARYGYYNYLDPLSIHYHYAGARGYSRHYTDEYYMNLMASAYVIGGQKWLDTLFDSLCTKSHPRYKPELPMYDLMQMAVKRSETHKQEVDSHSKYSLDELLERFSTEQIAY